MAVKKYDLIILGGGAAAFAAAIKANELKAKTLMINDGLPLGGTCVNVGCVPSKAMLKAAELKWQTEHHNYTGMEFEIKKIDYSAIVQEQLDLVEAMRDKKYESVLKHLENVSLLEGRAKFVSRNQVEVKSEKIEGNKFIIATGSTAAIPDIKGIDKINPLTHIEALQLKKVPKTLLVVGTGPVGLEFSQMFNRFGSKVTLLQRSDRLYRRTEPELSAKLAEYLSQEGVQIIPHAAVQSVKEGGKKKVLTIKVGEGIKEIVVDEVLMAAGKKPNTADLQLDKAGVQVNEKSAVMVSDTLMTNNPNVLAAGDVVALPKRLETTAGKEGTVAAENALTNSTKKINYPSVPYAIFTDPELAGVGLTDEEAVGQGFKCSCGTVPFSEVPKSHVIRNTQGLIKMVIDHKTNHILGVHILAPNAADLIHEATLAVKFKLKTTDIMDTLHVFPTLSEATKIAAQSFTVDITKLSCCV